MGTNYGLMDGQDATAQIKTPEIQGAPGFGAAVGTVAIQSTGNRNNYWQLSLQNTNTGTSASSDFVITCDTGSDSTDYADFGINNSNGATTPFTAAKAAYYYTTTNELDLGALGTTGKINFWGTGTTAAPAQIAQMVGVASAVDYITLTPSAAGTPGQCVIGVAGTDANINIQISPKGNGSPRVGAWGLAHAIYNFAVDGGADTLITPAVNSTIPANAVLVACTINSTTAVTSGGSATLAIGVAGTGGAANSLLAATGKASFSANAVLNGAVTFAAPLKLTGAGGITVTPAVATITAGVVEIWVQYYIASA